MLINLMILFCIFRPLSSSEASILSMSKEGGTPTVIQSKLPKNLISIKVFDREVQTGMYHTEHAIVWLLIITWSIGSRLSNTINPLDFAPNHIIWFFLLYKKPLLLEIVWIIVVMYKCMTEVQLSIVIVHEHWWYMNMLMSIHYIDDAWTCPCKHWCFMNMPMYYIDDTWTCPCIVF